jgi:ATP-binding cassette, subfamily C, bacterial CydC
MIADLRRILGLWRGQFAWLVAGVLVSLGALAAAVGLMTYGAMALIGVAGVPLILRALGSGRVLLRYAERMVTHTAMFRALSDVRVWFFRRLAAGSAGGLGFRRAGDLLARLVGDVEALDGLYLRILVPLAGAVLLLPVLARGGGPIVAVLFLVAAFALPWFAARAARGAGDTLAQAAGRLRIVALDALTGLREVRAFAAEGRMLALVQAREAVLLAAQHSLAKQVALAGALAFLCGQAALLAALSGGGIVAVFLVVAGFEAIGGLPRAGALLGHAAAAAHRVLEAADEPVPVPDPVTPGPAPQGTRLRFEGVTFRWQPDRPPVFDGLTLDIPPGARIALLGPSGIGKSSLAALALKVAAPQAGRILLGEVDLATLPAAEVRSRIGWLSQATHLFDDTIRANLLLARPDAPEDAIWAALEAARIAEVVRALPDGLDTWVGEAGTRFSGGQGRRLALARALLSPAPILILDEPCAGLDAATEREFLTTLNDTAEGRTIILIAHRLIGVERLDRIFRLSGGKAVAAAG